ncbi:hypothetical protein ACROYT_G009419 [Oculina patagonica]
MRSFSASLASVLGFTLIATVSFRVAEAAHATNDQETLVYVFGSEGVYIIEPKSKKIVSKITAADGICTKSNNRFSRDKCSFGGEIAVKDELVFFSDMPGNRVHVIDVHEQKVTETIATEGYPVDLYYLPWLEEVWVHTWTNSTFDVISTAGDLKKTHKAIKAHVQPGWTHGYMFANKKVKDGKVGYVTHMFNPGLHQLDLSSKTYKGFVNVSSYGCTGTFYFAYSSVNEHAFFDCRGQNAVLELDVTKDQIVRKWNFTGVPYTSPDGRFIVSIYKSINESINVLLASKVYVLVVSDKVSAPVLKSPIDIPGGVSDLVFDPKNSAVAYISLIYSDKIAVLDLKLLQVTYIKGVGTVLFKPGMHAVSRPLIMAGSWIVTPATATNSVAIIDAATRELHGMVSDVPGGRGLVAVHPKALSPPSAAPGNHYHSREMLVLTLLSALCVIAA